MADRSLRLTLEQVAAVAGLLAEGGTGRIELETPRGRFEVALSLPPAVGGTAHVVAAPVAGTFLAAHPHRAGPLVAPGQTVRPGDVVALLQVGPLLVPVAWDAAAPAVLTRVLAEPGALVGFGAGLMELREG